MHHRTPPEVTDGPSVVGSALDNSIPEAGEPQNTPSGPMDEWSAGVHSRINQVYTFIASISGCKARR